MNLTLHLVAKDVRHLRRALILWIGLLISQLIVSYRLVSNSEKTFAWFERMEVLHFLLLCLGWMVTYLLIGMLVLEDPVAGEKMFWATRPIKGGRLLMGKLITALLIFGALPLVVRAPWWLLCDFSFGDMMIAAVRMTGLQLLFAIAAFAMASLSANVGRFLLMSVLLAMGAFFVEIVLMGTAEASYALRMTREMVALVLFGVTGVIGTIMMYRTRRVGRVMVVMGLGLSLTILAGMKFPVELSNPFSRQMQVAPLENSSEIAVKLSSVRLDIPKNKTGSLDSSLTMDLRVLNLPETLGVNSGKADVTLRWADGTTVRSSSELKAFVQNDSLPLYPTFGLTGKGFRWHWDAETADKMARSNEELFERVSRKGVPIQRRDPDVDKGRYVYLSGSFSVSDKIAEKIMKEPPTYRINLDIEAGVPEVLGEIAFEPGSVVTRHGRVELLSFIQSPQSETKVARNGRRFDGTFSVLQGLGQSHPVVFCCIDRQHQVVARMTFFDQTEPASPIAEHITWVSLPFEAPRIWRTDRWIEVPDWQKNLRIGVVTFKPAGTFERTLEGERLIVANHEKTDMSTQSERAGN